MQSKMLCVASMFPYQLVRQVTSICFHSYSGGVNFDAQSDQVDGHSPSIHLRAHRGNQSLSFSNCEVCYFVRRGVLQVPGLRKSNVPCYEYTQSLNENSLLW